MITLALPWALVLLVPAAAAWWAWARHGPGAVWRAVVLALLVVAASRPQLTRDDGGSDVLLVIDRSASMGEARRGHEELTRLVGDGRKRGDRLAVIAVGTEARVAQGPQNTGVPRLDDLQVDAQGSDIDAGLEAAATLIAPGRSVRVLLASDGEATGLDPRRAAARLALLGAPVDVLPERRVGAADAAVADLDLPGGLRRGESFLGAIELVSDRAESRAWKVLRGDTVIAGGTAQLRPDRPLTVAFSDRPGQPGLVAYTIVLDDRDDRQTANNTAHAWVRVEAGERVLVVGGDGTRGNIANALAAAGLEVATRSAGPLRLSDLLGCQAVVLAEVPASALGHAGMSVLARWVREMGGGLVMTGGRQSFGSGGWHRSPVEPILPVSLEVRDEHRVLSVAMAIAIDRSGSMSVQIPDGRQKIQLAAEGAAAAIELLGPRDRIAVMAVDTAPHEILPMSRVEDPKGMARDVLGMESAGGGIYIYEALAAAGKELLRTDAGTRHLLLFADASDSEEPGDYINLLAEYRKHGITVSVVGMGEETDSDAQLLIDVAKRGGGRIAFASDPADLPRLFAQETVLVARNPWVDQAISPTPADLRVFGSNAEGLRAAWPQIPGYNLTYPRPGALIHAWCPGDPKAPAAASWNTGVGRAAALPIPCDAADAAALVAWPGYAPLLSSLTRWAAGNEAQSIGVVSARRRGGMAEIRLELDPARQGEWPVAPPELLLIRDEAAPSRPIPLLPLDAGVWTAQVRLTDRPTIPAVALGGSAVLGPALALPMPAEVAPRRDLPDGMQLLEDIAQVTGGRMRGDVLGIWDNPPSSGVTRELAHWLVIAALLAALCEVAFRRLRLQPRLVLPKLPRRHTVSAPVATTPKPVQPGPAEPQNTPTPQTAPPPTPAAAQPTVLDAFDQVRKRR